jgi:hypothetical protein
VLATCAAALFAFGILVGPAWAHRKGKHHARHHSHVRHHSHARPAVSGDEVSVSTVAKGLDNPRDLTWGPGDALYVAEAGHGAEPGSKECIPGGPAGPEAMTCVGFTSSVSAIDHSGVHKVVSGLVSTAEANGSFALGVSGVSGSSSELEALEGESASGIPPEASKFVSAATLTKAKEELGRLFEIYGPNNLKFLADVGDFDFQWALEHKSLVPEQFPDANPYALLAAPNATWVIDAASNTLDERTLSGQLSVKAFFPNPPVSDAVPTCIDQGPDGAFYVSQLTGLGNKAGAGNVWRVVPGQEPTVWASGLTSVTGCGFGPDGQFYAVEFSNKPLQEAAPGTGEVVRVPQGSTSPTPIVEHLSFPNGFAPGRWDDSLYISNWSVAPASGAAFGGATGEVLRISLGESGYGGYGDHGDSGRGHVIHSTLSHKHKHKH